MQFRGVLDMNSRVAALVNRFKARQVVSTSVMLITLTLGILIGTVLSRSGVRGNSDNAAGAALGPYRRPSRSVPTSPKAPKNRPPRAVNSHPEPTPNTTRP